MVYFTNSEIFVLVVRMVSSVNCLSKTELSEFLELARQSSLLGKVPDYIPELGKANKDDLAVAVYSESGNFFAGNVEKRFTLQSVSKILSLAIALADLGVDQVFQKVGMEPTGDPFNSISKLENNRLTKPLNPMINAGALTVIDMIKGDSSQKFERILSLVRQMANNPTIDYSIPVAGSEFETAYLNRALCFFLKQYGFIDTDVEQLLNVYTKQCAIEVNCIELARIGFVLSNRGFDPETGKEVLPADITKIITTFMVTCGMYNESGEFAIKVGIPAKSGVSGAILGFVPNKIGIGIYGPSLNDKGNSIAGIKLMELLSKKLQLNIF